MLGPKVGPKVGQNPPSVGRHWPTLAELGRPTCGKTLKRPSSVCVRTGASERSRGTNVGRERRRCQLSSPPSGRREHAKAPPSCRCQAARGLQGSGRQGRMERPPRLAHPTRHPHPCPWLGPWPTGRAPRCTGRLPRGQVSGGGSVSAMASADQTLGGRCLGRCIGQHCAELGPSAWPSVGRTSPKRCAQGPTRGPVSGNAGSADTRTHRHVHALAAP